MENTIRAFIYEHKEELMLFDLVHDEEMELIIPYFEIVHFREGTTLFSEGDHENFIGFIISGRIEVMKDTDFKGRRIVIAALSKGSLVGGMSLVNVDAKRAVSAVALENSELVKLSRDDFERILEKYPNTGIKILRGLNQILAIRLQKCFERLADVF
jgi:CRP-like cAMP-binding protein